MLDYFGKICILWNMLDDFGLFGTILDNFEENKSIIMDDLGQFWTKLDHVGLFGPLLKCFERFDLFDN